MGTRQGPRLSVRHPTGPEDHTDSASLGHFSRKEIMIPWHSESAGSLLGTDEATGKLD